MIIIDIICALVLYDFVIKPMFEKQDEPQQPKLKVVRQDKSIHGDF
jgi:hypothetical protein